MQCDHKPVIWRKLLDFCERLAGVTSKMQFLDRERNSEAGREMILKNPDQGIGDISLENHLVASICSADASVIGRGYPEREVGNHTGGLASSLGHRERVFLRLPVEGLLASSTAEIDWASIVL